MLGIILFSMVGVAGVAMAMGLMDDDSEAAVRAVDEADLHDDLPLLDESEIERMEQALAEDPLLAQDAVGPEEEALEPYEDLNGFADIDGSAARDLIAIPEDVGSDHDLIRAAGGEDVVIGNAGDNPMAGGEGDDLLFGLGAFDQIFGDEGNDTLAGGAGGDLLYGDVGSDVIYGGAGNDALYDGTADGTDTDSTDVIVAGDGDDGVIVQDGVNLVSLGEGEDHVTVFTREADNPGAVISDFDPEQDALLLDVFAPDVALPVGANGIELGYTLREVETELGRGTLVQPTGTEEIDAAALGDGASVGYALLLGLRPQDLVGTDIRVVLETPETDRFAAGSVEAVAQVMGATRL
ncbi:MAG: hypothetical protein O9328_09425 [Rhodobacteraceae bacterium]|nr:hypothetical protein [Paracoccaceae bacterium]